MTNPRMHFETKDKEILCKQKSAYPLPKTEHIVRVTCKECHRRYKRYQLELSLERKYSIT